MGQSLSVQNDIKDVCRCRGKIVHLNGSTTRSPSLHCIVTTGARSFILCFRRCQQSPLFIVDIMRCSIGLAATMSLQVAAVTMTSYKPAAGVEAGFKTYLQQFVALSTALDSFLELKMSDFTQRPKTAAPTHPFSPSSFLTLLHHNWLFWPIRQRAPSRL